jgi:hypothetical protein
MQVEGTDEETTEGLEEVDEGEVALFLTFCSC